MRAAMLGGSFTIISMVVRLVFMILVVYYLAKIANKE